MAFVAIRKEPKPPGGPLSRFFFAEPKWFPVGKCDHHAIPFLSPAFAAICIRAHQVAHLPQPARKTAGGSAAVIEAMRRRKHTRRKEEKETRRGEQERKNTQEKKKTQTKERRRKHKRRKHK
jgi:hypothetical protein